METHFDPSVADKVDCTSSNALNSDSSPTHLLNAPNDLKSDSVFKVDIVASSPYEIVSHIFSYIPVETANICTQVSRKWRATLLQCSEPWRHIDSRNSYVVHKLPISQHVQILFLTGTVTRLTSSISLLQTRNFSNLTTLSLVVRGTQNLDTMLEHLYSALSNVSQSLKKLVYRDSQSLKKLIFRDEESEISLHRILSACRNLTALKITVGNIIDTSLLYTTLLTDVYLYIYDPDMNLYDLEPMFRCSPHLLHFTLECSVDNSIIPVIGTHCPKLCSIVTNLSEFQKVNGYGIHGRLRDVHEADNLHCLVLNILIDPLPVLSRFQQCRNTLRTLCFAPTDGATPQHWHCFSSFTLPTLTYLQFSGEHSPINFIRDHLPTMLKSNPSIETLVLQTFYEHSDIDVTAAIYDAMTQLPKLSCLRFVHFKIHSDAFLRFLEHPTICLRELHVSGYAGCVSVVLFRIARISTLEHLAIFGLDIDVTVQEFNQFLLLAARNLVRLTSLSLCNMRFNDEDAHVVASFKSLSSLMLPKIYPDRSGELSSEGLCYLQNRIKHVQLWN